ncbi:Crp/Fnr family transcriptional regulator [Ructibacterium gallinarum]|uniref:Crp/Fnr family transcriptional regulator n=1 Tax=Ructibacterium gallinarum TaxID=2779355 RepID=A0A9D5M5Z7_9FIRM|nr:Crp/Fnr family transcriptional regulator [Ructibacterium gallinarum]MBE5041225.1 Crp/Fnr family transcriptional regulator [Ructibacterium gallinarum]
MKLAQTPLFEGITEQDCRQMIRCFGAAEREFSPGQTLYDFGSEESRVGILTAGQARVVRIDIDGNRTILETLGPGEVFGTLFTFYSRTGDSVTAVCERECRAVFIDRGQITKRCSRACACHSRLVENLLSLVSAKAIYLSSRIEILSRRSIREKLLCYFGYCQSLSGGREFTLPFSLSALAEYICADRSAMMRQIKQLREEGLIVTRGRQIRLSAPGKNGN